MQTVHHSSHIIFIHLSYFLTVILHHCVCILSIKQIVRSKKKGSLQKEVLEQEEITANAKSCAHQFVFLAIKMHTECSPAPQLDAVTVVTAVFFLFVCFFWILEKASLCDVAGVKEQVVMNKC